MGAALGFALAGGTALMLLVFVALGVGMALPYVLLAWFPGWRERLPRPGRGSRGSSSCSRFRCTRR